MEKSKILKNISLTEVEAKIKLVNLVLPQNRKWDAETINLIAELLKEKYAFTTLEDFTSAIKKGVLGDFNKESTYNEINVTTVSLWIRKYLNSKPDFVSKEESFKTFGNGTTT